MKKIHFSDAFATADEPVKTNVLELLDTHLATTARKFSKVGGRVVSPRGEFIKLLNNVKNEVNNEYKERDPINPVKVSQYDAFRMLQAGERKPNDQAIFRFGDGLVDILSASGRCSKAIAYKAMDVLAEDYALDPRNIYVDKDDLYKAIPDSEIIETV